MTDHPDITLAVDWLFHTNSNEQNSFRVKYAVSILDKEIIRAIPVKHKYGGKKAL